MNSQQNIIALSNWQGGKLSLDRRVLFKMDRGAKNKDGHCPLRKIIFQINDNEKKINLYEEKFEVSDYIENDLTREEAEEKTIEIANKIRYEKCGEYGLLKNMWRKIKYGGIECAQVLLNGNISMIVDINCLDDITQHIWTCAQNTNRNGDSGKYNVFTSPQRNKKIYLSKFLCIKNSVIDDNNDIIEFVNGNSLDLRLENMTSSGHSRVNATIKEIKTNNKTTKNYLENLEKIREENKIQPYLVIDKVLSKWKEGRQGGYVVERDNKYSIILEWKNKNKTKTTKIIDVIFTNENKKEMFDKSLKMLRALRQKYPEKLMINSYRDVIYKGTKCIEMQLIYGQTTVFDESFLPKILKYYWYPIIKSENLVCISCSKNGKIKHMHRMILNDKTCEVVDHISGEERDNRLCNLRAATRSQNANNCKLSKRNKTGVNGLGWDSSQNRYRVRWTEDGKEKMRSFSVGTYGSEENAKGAAMAFKIENDKRIGNTNGQRA